MPQQTINVGSVPNDPTAESVLSAFTKINAMTAELYTLHSLSNRPALDLDATPDSIRAAFVKVNTMTAALFTAAGISGQQVISVGAALDDPAAETIRSAYTKVNAMMGLLYAEPPNPVAFPGAIGFGASTRHAYAGSATPRIIRVNSLVDSASPPSLTAVGDGTFRGQLRRAILDPNPRIIIFEVSGYIPLVSRLIVTSPYCYIAGATAPSPGISLRNFAFSVQANDVVVQHIRQRVGDSAPVAGNGEDGMYIAASAQRVILDHISIAWAVDGSIDATQGLRDITISNCIMAEPLRFNATHGPQLIGGTLTRNVSTFRNLFAHATTRCPRIADGARAVAINNLVYDSYTSIDMHIDDQVIQTGVPVYASFVSNRSIQGPTGGTVNRFCVVANDNTVTGSKLYHTGNSFSGANYISVYRSTTDSGIDPAAGVTAPPPEQPLPADVPIMASTAVEAYVLANAGARPLNRDPVDDRIITNVTNRTTTSTNIQTQASVGGYPALANNPRALTLPANPHDVSAIGYTNLENWLAQAADSVTTPGSPSWP